jgi:hypothetical protein
MPVMKEPTRITLKKLKRYPKLGRFFAHHLVRIWSGEHGCWWRPNGAGYTVDALYAGVYFFDDAYKRTRHCGPEKQIEFVSNYGMERVCVQCGCRDSIACEGGCSWAVQHPATPTGVCSECAAIPF